jgi:hypothetical protein
MMLIAAGAALHCLGDPARTAGAWQQQFRDFDVLISLIPLLWLK